MYNQYQEDLSVNPFFKVLKRSKLYNLVERNSWLVCVPQASSLAGLKITQDILDVHVLQPSPYFQGEYITANNKTVRVEDGVITIASDLREQRQAKILFEESFYSKDSKSFRVLCIDVPLAGELKKPTREVIQLPSTKSLADISTFLHSFPINSFVLTKVHEQIDELSKSYVIVKGFEEQAVEKAKALSVKALEDLVCANPDFRHLYEDDHLNNELSLIVESYVIGALHSYLFPALRGIFGQEDARLRDNMLSYRSRDLAKELDLKPDLVPHVAHITPHLQRLETCVTPLEKLWCIQEGMDAAAFAVSISRSGNDSLGADDSLPLLLAALIQVASSHLHTSLYWIQNFVFANIAATQLGYHLVNLQAAVHYIRGEEEEAEGESMGSSPTSSSLHADSSSLRPLAINPNRFSTSYITDSKTTEILDYLTGGVSDSANFTPHRYTSSTPRAESMINLHTSASSPDIGSFYRPSKMYTSTTNPLMNELTPNGWVTADPRAKSPTRNVQVRTERSRSEDGIAPPLSSGLSPPSPTSAFKPQPQYKRPPTVIKIDTTNNDVDGDGGGFLAQLRKLDDGGVSRPLNTTRW